MSERIPAWFEEFSSHITWDEFNQNIHIDLVNKYVYVETAKAACSTIKSRLHEAVMRGLPKPKEIHPTLFCSPFVRPYQVPDELAEEILFGDSFFRFSFVREPIERVLSAYLDKIKRPMPQRERLLKRFFPDSDPDYEPSFEEFVACLLKTKSVKNFDKHWRPQTTLLFIPKLRYHFIGCLSRFEEDWAALLNAAGIETASAERRNIVWHATAANEKLKAYISDELRESLNHIYKDDLALYADVLEGRRAV